MSEFQPAAEQFLHLLRGSVGMLSANPQARHLAGQFMESQGNTNPLLARHAAVTIKLKFQCGLRCHCIPK
jgi:hypothetical protein